MSTVDTIAAGAVLVVLAPVLLAIAAWAGSRSGAGPGDGRRR